MPKMKRYDSYADWKREQSAKNKRLIGALQRFIEEAAPRLTTTTVKWGQGCFVAGDAPKIYIHAEPDHVQLGFYRGTTLDDPGGLLIGSGKHVRHVKVRSAGDIQPEVFTFLIRQAVGSPDGEKTAMNTSDRGRSRQPQSVGGYIAAAPGWARGTLQELRRAIKAAAPDAKESISYKMPYYSQNGRLGYFGVYKTHCSFHWISGDDKRRFGKELKKQTVVGSTLRIPRGGKVPVGLIKRIIKSRVRRNESKV